MTNGKQNVDISVIIPVYNAELYLQRTLGSLIKQKKKNMEFICVNDGSTDNSLKILQEFAKKDNRFIILDKKNGGVSTARNLGLECASGTYIMFLDADDWYEEDACEKAFQLITQYGVDVALFCMTMEYAERAEYKNILSGRFEKFDEQGCKNLHRRCIGLIGQECRELRKFDYLSVLYLKIYRKDIIEQYDIRFEDIRKTGSFEDGLFNIEYFSHISSAVYTAESYYHYNRCNESSITTKYREELPKQWEYLFQVIKKHIEEANCKDCEQALNNRIAYAVFPLGLNVVSGDLSIYEKYKKIRELVKSQKLHRSFTYSEIIKMPIAFKVFFLLSKWKWSLAIYLLLCVMQFVRNKNKGIK